jgi:hypothetical protein
MLCNSASCRSILRSIASKLLREVLVHRKHPPEVDEGPHHLNAGLNRHRALQQVRQHDCPMLGENVGQMLDIVAFLQDHRL